MHAYSKEGGRGQNGSGDGLVAIVGCGYVGTLIALLASQRGFRVIGIDVNADLVSCINRFESPVHEPEAARIMEEVGRSGRLSASTSFDAVQEADYILITVGTPLDACSEPDLGALRHACREVAPYLCRGQLVVLKSTVAPGTTEGEVRRLLEEGSGLVAEDDFLLAYCPERLAEGSNIHDFEGSALQDAQGLPILVGGIGPRSREAAEYFWQRVGLETFSLSSATAAEMVKLADNWWIDVNIALANELGKLCEHLGLDALEVIRAANTLPKGAGHVNFLFPGAGVGGSCLTKDPYFVHHLGREYGLDLQTPLLSRQVNDSMPGHVASLIMQALSEYGKAVGGSTVTVLGLAFKNATSDMRSTPAKPLIEILREAGARVRTFDPWVNPADARNLTGLPLSATLEEAVTEADVIALVTPHPEFRAISFAKIWELVAHPCSVVDGRRAFDPATVLSAGFDYRAVGLGMNEGRGG